MGLTTPGYCGRRWGVAVCLVTQQGQAAAGGVARSCWVRGCLILASWGTYESRAVAPHGRCIPCTVRCLGRAATGQAGRLAPGAGELIHRPAACHGGVANRVSSHHLLLSGTGRDDYS